MKALIFGANGQVGRALMNCPDVVGMERIGIGRREADLFTPGACQAAIAANRPDIVINAAAFTDVDLAETLTAAAMRINAAAPAEMARACQMLSIPLLHLSTEYVFDGSGVESWHPNSKPNPINSYGRSKRAGEQAIAANSTHFLILRTSWVFSDCAHNFVQAILRHASKRNQLRVVHDQIGGPTSAQSLAKAVVIMAHALVMGHPGGVFHFSGAKDINRADFARAIVQAAGLDTIIEPVATSAFPTPAKRPLNSRLNCQSTLDEFSIPRPDWQRDLQSIFN